MRIDAAERRSGEGWSPIDSTSVDRSVSVFCTDCSHDVALALIHFRSRDARVKRSLIDSAEFALQN